MPAKRADWINKRFGRLVVVADAGKLRGYFAYECKCDCGAKVIVGSDGLRRGTKSCGCLAREKAALVAVDTGHKNKTHGQAGTPTYRVWASMLNRCQNPNSSSYSIYGQRGIRVCKRWQVFANFFADMGQCPPGMTLERKNGNGHYCKSNVIWATRLAQARNKRNNVRHAFGKLRLTIGEWSERTGIPVNRIQKRLTLGWTIGQAVGLETRDKATWKNSP